VVLPLTVEGGTFTLKLEWSRLLDYGLSRYFFFASCSRADFAPLPSASDTV
jgi:hypothetical protein